MATVNTQLKGNEEKLEGLETPSFDLGDYPIDSLLIRAEQRTVYDVIRRINKDQYILHPDFQRDFVWDLAKQSKLIESTLMRIPLPVFYLAESPDGKVIVVDGLQRLTTFWRFLGDELTLEGLKGNSTQFNGLRFHNLPPKLQNRIEDTQLILYLIDSKVPERAQLDIFERVNSGVELTRQQMRNSLYVGPATRWLRERAKSKVFLEATGGSLNQLTMRDREAINRFCGFQLLGVSGYGELKGDLDEFLAQTLKHMNSQGAAQLQTNLTPAFERSMRNNLSIFGKHAFRRHQSKKESRSPFNIALFDVYSVLMTRYSEAFVDAHKATFYERFLDLQKQGRFVDAISHSTNSVKNVTTRFELVEEYHPDLTPDIEEA